MHGQLIRIVGKKKTRNLIKGKHGHGWRKKNLWKEKNHWYILHNGKRWETAVKYHNDKTMDSALCIIRGKAGESASYIFPNVIKNGDTKIQAVLHTGSYAVNTNLRE